METLMSYLSNADLHIFIDYASAKRNNLLNIQREVSNGYKNENIGVVG
jgi:hypothetical protein